MSEVQTSQETVDKKETATITEENITLDDVYRDAGLDKIETQQQTQQQTQQTQQQTQQQTTVEPSTVPDPYDSEKFKAYMARQSAETTALRSTLGNVAQFLTTMQAKAQKEALESDIKSAVETVNTDLQAKPKLVEALLDAEARENPKFKAIWENRGKNPVALSNALKILSKKFGEELSVKVDPALVAAQRARKLSQQQMATTTAESDASPQEERLAAAQGSDFDAEWQKLLGGA